MKILKNMAFVFAAVILVITGSKAYASEGNSKEVISGTQLNDGVYEIEVSSSSSMFKIIKASLSVNEGEMKAVLTLSGKGYEKLYMGTGDEALVDDDSACIYYVEDAEGKYTYEVPVEALNKETDVAAWSIKKEKWYDRTLVFESNNLPEEAFKTNALPILPIICVVIFVVIASAVVIIVRKRNKK